MILGDKDYLFLWSFMLDNIPVKLVTQNQLNYFIHSACYLWSKARISWPLKWKWCSTHITRKLHHLYPPAECCDQQLKNHAVLDRQKQHFSREDICAIKIIPVPQKSRKVVTEHAFNLNLVQAFPMTESMTDENLLFYVGSMQRSVAQIEKKRKAYLCKI